MFRAIATKTVQIANKRTVAPMAVRGFSGILSEAEQQAGRRKEEIDAESTGGVAFNRDPIIPAVDAGTKENPILVPSGNSNRVVGYEDPYTHQLVWFTLKKGPLHLIPEIGLYFKLQSV